MIFTDEELLEDALLFTALEEMIGLSLSRVCIRVSIDDCDNLSSWFCQYTAMVAVNSFIIGDYAFHLIFQTFLIPMTNITEFYLRKMLEN